MPLHNAHVAEFYYAKAMHAERHYFAATCLLYRKLYYHLALSLTLRASNEEHALWAAYHA